MAPEDEDPAADQEFFAAIEERFVRLRGTTLLLSPADWQLARGWKREGIPLELVLTALDLAFERFLGGRRRGKISSLRYCNAFVEELWQERLELGPAAPIRTPAAPLDVGARLEALAARIPADLPDRASVVQSILALHGNPEEVESGLAAIQQRTLEHASSRLDPAAQQALERAMERSLTPLQARLAPSALEEARDRLRARALQRQIALPELSLFAFESPLDLADP